MVAACGRDPELTRLLDPRRMRQIGSLGSPSWTCAEFCLARHRRYLVRQGDDDARD
jgi:hypothetical protein